MLNLIKYLKSYKILILAIIALILVQAMSDLALPDYTSRIVNVGIQDAGIVQSTYIFKTGIIMLLIALLSMTASFAVVYIASRIAAGLGLELRRKMFKKIIGFSNFEFDKFSSASLITRTTNDIQQVQSLMVMFLRLVFYAPILGAGAVIKVYNSDSTMWWVIAIAVGAILSVIVTLFSLTMPKYKNLQNLIDKLNLVTREMLTGIPVIRAFSRQAYQEKKFDEANKELTRTNLFVSRVMATMAPLMMLIMNGTTLLIIWVGAHQIDRGIIQIGDMMAFVQYAMQIIMSFLMISMVSIMLPRATVAAQRINEVLEAEYTIKNSKEVIHFSKNIRGQIEFDNVCFKYPGAKEEALSNISFSAEPGQIIAFIGSTGSGKSTLVNLIPRFYDVTFGRILIDGIDVRDIAQQELRAEIGYVAQKETLFSGTIESNLRYGFKNTTDYQLTKSVEIAQAVDFINEKPDRFKTHISQGGKNVSGGQKQRLAIARALIKKPKIFIFDDSFSALDFKTESLLHTALRNEIKNSTVLIVAQRISTIINADQIIVLEKGIIVGSGTHKQLMETCEVYRQLANSQLEKEVRA